jgi:CBS domain-containing protein
MTKAPDTIGEIMTVSVVGVGPDDPVSDAVQAMVDHDIGSVLVVEGDRAVGIFTERDLTRRVLSDPELLRRPIREVMCSPVHATRPEAEIQQAFDLMNEKRVRRLAVVDGGRLVGIVTERDLLRWVSAVAAE